MSSVDPVVDVEAAAASAAAPAGTAVPLLGRVNNAIRKHTDRFLNLPSVLTLIAVAIILVLCVMLWDIAWLRPILATAGAGLAAFLGPIPGIITPETRSKWLVTIFVSGLIAAGTWFATKDLAEQLRASENEKAQITARLVQAKDVMVTMLQAATGPAQDAAFLKSAELLKTMQHDGKYDCVIDLAHSMLRIRPNNGAALAFAGYAYRSLGDFEQAKKRFESYIAIADTEPLATDGPAAVCYDRVNGFCGERTGWVEHRLAVIAILQAREATGDAKASLLEEAVEHERRNVGIVKWSRPGKDQGFSSNDEEEISSCAVLEEAIEGITSLGRPTSGIIDFRKANLNCG